MRRLILLLLLIFTLILILCLAQKETVENGPDSRTECPAEDTAWLWTDNLPKFLGKTQGIDFKSNKTEHELQCPSPTAYPTIASCYPEKIYELVNQEETTLNPEKNVAGSSFESFLLACTLTFAVPVMWILQLLYKVVSDFENLNLDLEDFSDEDYNNNEEACHNRMDQPLENRRERSAAAPVACRALCDSTPTSSESLKFKMDPSSAHNEALMWRDLLLLAIPHMEILKELYQIWVNADKQDQMNAKELLYNFIRQGLCNPEITRLYRLAFALADSYDNWTYIQDTQGACGTVANQFEFTRLMENDLYSMVVLLQETLTACVKMRSTQAPMGSSARNGIVQKAASLLEPEKKCEKKKAHGTDDKYPEIRKKLKSNPVKTIADGILVQKLMESELVNTNKDELSNAIMCDGGEGSAEFEPYMDTTEMKDENLNDKEAKGSGVRARRVKGHGSRC